MQSVLSLSGGLDSSTLLLHLLAKGDTVTALSFDYGQKHNIELKRAKQLVRYLKSQNLPVTHQVIELKGLQPLLNSTLVKGGSEVPEGHYEQENMKETVVPNRNKIFSSIIQAVALSIANETKEVVNISLGIHAGDHCFTRDTNLLTPSGYKTIENLNIGDPIYSFNLKTNNWELDKVTDIIKKSVVEKVNKINTYAGSVKLTDEHNVFRLKLGDFHQKYGYSKSIEKIKVSELNIGDYLIQPTNLYNNDKEFTTFDLLPLVQDISKKYVGGLEVSEEDEYIWLGSNKDKYKRNKIQRFIDTNSLVKLYAWFIAEGTSQKDPYNVEGKKSRYTASFGQSLKANLDKVDIIQKMINDNGWPIKFHFSKTLHNGIPKDVTYYCSNIIALLLKECGSRSNKKNIPDWLFDLLLSSSSLREEFIYIMGIADGFNTDTLNKGFCTSSPKLLEQMILLYQLSGYHFSINSESKNSSTRYVTYSKVNSKSALISLGDAKFTKIKSIEEVEYNDNVFDISVENNHNFFAGEFGSILISNSIYPDCRQEFRDADQAAFVIGNWNSELVQVYTPYLEGTKYDILKDGIECCKQLGLSFTKVYRRTNTSYKPIEWRKKWFSDYKSASSVERIEAFIKLKRKDPVRYADETGPVNWPTVKKYVKTLLENHK